MDFQGCKVAVLGLASSGLAAVELLASQGASVIAVDVKPLDQLPVAAQALARLGVPFRLQSPEALADAEYVVVSPGVPADLEILNQARSRGVPVIGEVELAFRFLQGEIIGITGSNGKTTTTALVGHLLQQCGIPAQVGGNIGTVPASAMVRRSRPGQWNVLELSSFQLETIQHFRARIGVALNVTEDHLDRHGTFERYAAAKARLFENQTAEDWAVLNADDPVTRGYASGTAARPLWFSLTHRVEPGAWLEEGILMLGGEPLLPASEVPLRGRHNLENILAASLAAFLAGAPASGIAGAIRTFRAVEHRLEYVDTIHGVAYYNDSKATNVSSAVKAAEAVDGPLWIILGGKHKGGSYTPLAEALRSKARAALLIGEAAPLIARAFEGIVPFVPCGTLEAAVAFAAENARSGDTVLLAPACASFDQFENYEHRGRAFKQLVARLALEARGKE
ncbi:MAG: UDP-N-acetylmuramoyl-L-alanine--D-glutamate ligase [Bryobacteraceae bacterium]|nr:UDP-N-acetylmuramoyl-L-alanine--D-glutamate ligase [Bryobacteraceae bacterium]